MLNRKEVKPVMKRFVIREVETLKTTAAMYGPCVEGCCWIEIGESSIRGCCEAL